MRLKALLEIYAVHSFRRVFDVATLAQVVALRAAVAGLRHPASSAGLARPDEQHYRRDGRYAERLRFLAALPCRRRDDGAQ